MLAERELINTIIINIKQCHETKTKFSDKSLMYNSKQTTLWNICTNTMKNKILRLEDARYFVRELLPITQDIISYSLNIDDNERDSWMFFNKAIETSGVYIDIPNTSKHIYKGRKLQKFWARYALKKLEDINQLINDSELQEHSIKILPYTNVPSKNIKLLYGKDILIMFKLISKEYPQIHHLNPSMCFRFDDIDISMKSLDIIKRENIDTYNYLINNIIH